jgi:hypothetical protein
MNTRSLAGSSSWLCPSRTNALVMAPEGRGWGQRGEVLWVAGTSTALQAHAHAHTYTHTHTCHARDLVGQEGVARRRGALPWLGGGGGLPLALPLTRRGHKLAARRPLLRVAGLLLALGPGGRDRHGHGHGCHPVLLPCWPLLRRPVLPLKQLQEPRGPALPP